MTVRAMAESSRAWLRRVGWLLMVALPVILAACGKGGSSGY
jgi:hypothetical protein